MHRCMKRSSPQASMPVSFSFPFQFRAFVQSSMLAKKVLNPSWLTTSKFPKKPKFTYLQFSRYIPFEVTFWVLSFVRKRIGRKTES